MRKEGRKEHKTQNNKNKKSGTRKSRRVILGNDATASGKR
jgi:hypothetical protein